MSATVTATFKAGNGNAIASEVVEFVMVEPPVAQNGGIIVTGLPEDDDRYQTKPRVKETTNASGEISVELESANYDVYIFRKKQFTIAVPSSGTHTIEDLITSDLVYTYAGTYFRNDGGRLQIKNESTGEWHSLLCSTFGGSVVLTVDQTGEAS